MLETTAENSVVIEKYFSSYIKARSEFRIGKTFSTVADPENFLIYMKNKDGVEEDKTKTKWDKVCEEIGKNKEEIKENEAPLWCLVTQYLTKTKKRVYWEGRGGGVEGSWSGKWV